MGRGKKESLTDKVKRNYKVMSKINSQGRANTGLALRAFKEGRKAGDAVGPASSKAWAVEAAAKGNTTEFKRRKAEIAKDRKKKAEQRRK